MAINWNAPEESMPLRFPPFRGTRPLRASALAAVVVILLSPAPAQAGGTRPIGTPCHAGDGEECTIAVISGRATADGRPILWKNRDTAYSDNEVVYFEDGTYKYLALTNAGDFGNAWIGVNERGFAILNALSYNLPDGLNEGITNGQLMKQALQICATVKEFEQYLELTNAIGRPNPANIAVIDAQGGAAMFEAGNTSFVRFDANDTVLAPEGFLARANFSLSADTTASDTYRYNRCRRLILDNLSGGKMTAAYMLQRVGRDLRSVDADPYPLPFQGSPPGLPGAIGYVSTTNTISRRTTTAAGAVLGVLPGENPLLSTFYAVVGPPIVTIPLPAWVAAGVTPEAMDGPQTSPLCDAAKERNRGLYDYSGSGILLDTRGLRGPEATWLDLAEETEKWIFRETESHLARWRERGIDPAEMRTAEYRIAQDGLSCYLGGTPSRRAEPVVLSAGPNPMRSSTVIRLIGSSPIPDAPAIEVFDVAGRMVARLPGNGGAAAGKTSLRWNGCDDQGAPVPSGVYYLRSLDLPGSPRASVVVIR
jgi:hypothetical protein